MLSTSPVATIAPFSSMSSIVRMSARRVPFGTGGSAGFNAARSSPATLASSTNGAGNSQSCLRYAAVAAVPPGTLQYTEKADRLNPSA